jgi:hypothetical protein
VQAYQSATNADPQLREAHYRLPALRRTEKAKAEQELAAYNRISREVLTRTNARPTKFRNLFYTLRDSK